MPHASRVDALLVRLSQPLAVPRWPDGRPAGAAHRPPVVRRFRRRGHGEPAADHNCWNPVRWTLNNNNDPADPRIKLGMYDNLQTMGIKTPLTDVNDLAKPNAEAILLAHGFKLESEKDGVKTYVLGNAMLHGNGQRAVLYPDDRSALMSFSQLPGGHVGLLESISRDADGTIHNGMATDGHGALSGRYLTRPLPRRFLG